MTEEYTQQELLEIEQNLKKASRNAQTVLAWRECHNDYSAHIFHYHGQKQRKDLDTYWSGEREDIAYAHGPHGFIGRDVVYNYFANMNELMHDAKLEYFAEKYPEHVKATPEFLGVGDYCIHALFTPYIQVAEDLKTATGYFHCIAICSEMSMFGKQEPMCVWGGYGVSFTNDSDGWKIWQLREYCDFQFDMPGWQIDHTDRPDPPRPPVAEQLRAAQGKPSLIPAPNFTAEGRGAHYMFRVAKIEPEMQAPYDSWDDSMSYMRDYQVAKVED